MTVCPAVRVRVSLKVNHAGTQREGVGCDMGPTDEVCAKKYRVTARVSRLESKGPVPRLGEQPGLCVGHSRPGGGLSHHCLMSRPPPGCGAKQPRGVSPGSLWLVPGDSLRLVRNKVAARTGRKGDRPVLGGAAEDCVGGWGLLSRKALPSWCSWIGRLTMLCCRVLPLGPVVFL